MVVRRQPFRTRSRVSLTTDIVLLDAKQCFNGAGGHWPCLRLGLGLTGQRAGPPSSGSIWSDEDVVVRTTLRRMQHSACTTAGLQKRPNDRTTGADRRFEGGWPRQPQPGSALLQTFLSPLHESRPGSALFALALRDDFTSANQRAPTTVYGYINHVAPPGFRPLYCHPLLSCISVCIPRLVDLLHGARLRALVRPLVWRSAFGFGV